MLEAGCAFDDVEALIDASPCTDDEKAALWLYAWSGMPEGVRLGVAEEVLELLGG